MFGLVIRPDIQLDICFGHINEQIWTKVGKGMYNVILKYAWKFQLDPDVRPDIRFINFLSICDILTIHTNYCVILMIRVV